jgi:phage shock protein C
MLAGVAGGVAETLDVDPSIIRILWALLAILSGGVAFVVYIVMAIVVPEEPEDLGAPTAVPTPGEAGAIAGDAMSPPPPPLPPAPVWPTRASERAARRAARRASRREMVDSGSAALIFGVVLIVIGGLFLLRQLVPWFEFHLWWPIAIVILGVMLIAVAVRPSRPSQ